MDRPARAFELLGRQEILRANVFNFARNLARERAGIKGSNRLDSAPPFF
jgi:hypothetical protein